MTRYSSGRAAEWRVRDVLAEAGATVVRSAGSKGDADLIAMWSHATYAIQVKKAKPSAQEMERCRAASEKTQARWAMVWVRPGPWEVTAFKGGKPYRILPPGLQSYRTVTSSHRADRNT